MSPGKPSSPQSLGGGGLELGLPEEVASPAGGGWRIAIGRRPVGCPGGGSRVAEAGLTACHQLLGQGLGLDTCPWEGEARPWCWRTALKDDTT